MPFSGEQLLDYLRQYLTPTPPQVPDYPQGPQIWSMPSNTPLPQRLARAKQESAASDLAIQHEQQKIRNWYGKAQQGEHKITSPVDPELEGTDWDRQYHSYLFNYNNVVKQINKVDDDFKAGKMSQADYDKANLAMLPAMKALDAKIKQLDAQRMLTAQRILKGLHGDYQI